MAETLSVNRPGMEVMVGGTVAVAFTSNIPGNASTDAGKPLKVSIAGAQADIVTWGVNNDLPNYREELVINNNIVPALIARRGGLVLGQEWFAYTEREETGSDGKKKKVLDEALIPADAAEFFEDNSAELAKVVYDLMKHDLAFIEVSKRRDKGLYGIQHIPTKYMRAGRKVDGRIKTWYYSNAWTQAQKKQLKPGEQMLREMPVYDKNKEQGRFVIVLGKTVFDDGYYPIPTWWGSKHWIELANVIPIFHAANLRNMSAPRWLLIVPHDYFRDYQKWDGATDEERTSLLADEKAKKQAFVDDFNSLVSGVGNSGRTLTIEEAVEEIGGKYMERRIKVEPLVIDLRDEALLKLFESSNQANTSAQGIHPTLANIETAGKLSSGSEMRNAYLMYIVVAVPEYRREIYMAVKIIFRTFNIGGALKYAIRDAELTTLADSPTGVTESTRNPAA